MKKLVLYILTVFILTNVNYAQETNGSQSKEELNTIYSNLEYNTIAFDDLKRKWFINDPGFIRELFNKFAVKNAFRINGQPADVQVVMEKANAVFDGEVIVDLRRRYYDEEFEYFAFISIDQSDEVKPIPLFDPVEDGFYLKEIIGPRLYDKMQEQTYFFSDVTKDVYETKYGYYFDIDLNMLEPELMFWSTTSGVRNKYLLSLFGKWGFDKIFLPGWFSAEYVAGVSLTYYNALGDDPSDYTYKLSVGTGTNTSKPFIADLPTMPMFKSGSSAYFALSGDLLKNITEEFENVYLNVESFITYADYKYKDFGIYNVNQDFVAVKNYFSLSWIYRDITNMFDFGQLYAGAGLASHDLHKLRIDQATLSVIDLENREDFDKFKHFMTFNVGIDNNGGLIQHDLQVLGGYNVSDGWGYYGATVKAMISSTFGFEVKVMNNFGIDAKQYDALWRGDYVVFSPILKINY
ncbi:MAG: hypothetical protein SCALA702_28650 [Melioribacteraceae bacterium]|nr:MAG: hypothetical protein SCALA702_28650 [Melioribacteraceae bacterium]